MKVRILLDENLSPRLKAGLLRYDPSIDILRVGDEDAPPLETGDADILLYLEHARRLLVTDNRSTIPDHMVEHFATGHHHWGVFEIRPSATIGQVLEILYLVWEASEAEEWIDQLRWIPF